MKSKNHDEVTDLTIAQLLSMNDDNATRQTLADIMKLPNVKRAVVIYEVDKGDGEQNIQYGVFGIDDIVTILGFVDAFRYRVCMEHINCVMDDDDESEDDDDAD